MSARETLDRILKTSLANQELRYCLVSEKKLPYKCDNTLARPNEVSDFVSIDNLLQCTSLDTYAGVGISIQASNIYAVDVDHCFSEPFNLMSADDRANDILERFVDIAYCEFSFSGTGLRVLFNMNKLIDDYSTKYYIKNTKKNVEFYQPAKSFRYVTVTGKVISDTFDTIDNEIVIEFLNDYMKRPVSLSSNLKTLEVETRSFEELMRLVKFEYFKNHEFQEQWFSNAPGSGRNESEKDFHLLMCLYESITRDKELIRQIFEASPYFKSKDSKHKYKWEYSDHRYFEYVYNQIRRLKS